MEEIKYPEASYPTKEEIMQILKEENPPVGEINQYNRSFSLLNSRKLMREIGIIKGELYGNEQLEYRGSILLPLFNTEANQQSNWNSIEVGKSIFYGMSLDTRELGLTEKVGDFIGRSLEEGKVQDFIPFFWDKIIKMLILHFPSNLEQQVIFWKERAERLPQRIRVESIIQEMNGKRK